MIITWCRKLGLSSCLLASAQLGSASFNVITAPKTNFTPSGGTEKHLISERSFLLRAHIFCELNKTDIKNSIYFIEVYLFYTFVASSSSGIISFNSDKAILYISWHFNSSFFIFLEIM